MKWLYVSSFLALAFYCAHSRAQGQYYRFVNDQGVKVLGHSVPPESVHKGYEIISATGRVLQVVEPAPNPADLEVERAKAELDAKYEILAKRYSTERDIEASKARKLVNIEASIILVENSINSVQSEISDITSRAAEFERAGKKVPLNILDNLKILNEKMVATKAILKLREEEKKEVVDRYDEDLKLFLSRAAPRSSSVSANNSSSTSSVVDLVGETSVESSSQ